LALQVRHQSAVKSTNTGRPPSAIEIARASSNATQSMRPPSPGTASATEATEAASMPATASRPERPGLRWWSQAKNASASSASWTKASRSGAICAAST
jgi:hypothetical protein